MRKVAEVASWVVYLMTVHGKPSGMHAVCEQGEWEAMERAALGYHTLVRSGIASESEAERLARGTSGDAKPRLPRRG
jgi:hypothetical protein